MQKYAGILQKIVKFPGGDGQYYTYELLEKKNYTYYLFTRPQQPSNSTCLPQKTEIYKLLSTSWKSPKSINKISDLENNNIIGFCLVFGFAVLSAILRGLIGRICHKRLTEKDMVHVYPIIAVTLIIVW
jgi:hypothetical protein